MAGYYGYSMSNNAVQAYMDGEKPLSKWRKKDILDAIGEKLADGEISLQCSMEQLRKTPAGALREICLCGSSSHHTSKYYNMTDFYGLDEDALEDLTDGRLQEISLEFREKQEKLKREKENEREEIWECTFLEWSGTRRHPKAEEITETGIIKGNWFSRPGGGRKSIHANGFRKIRRVDEGGRAGLPMETHRVPRQ